MVTVSSKSDIIDSGVDVASISKYSDLLNVMAFVNKILSYTCYLFILFIIRIKFLKKDFSDSTKDKYAGHSAPLFPRKNQNQTESMLNIDWVINNCLSKGVPKEKLLLGLTTSGLTFKLRSFNKTAAGSTVKSPGAIQPVKKSDYN